MNHEDEAKVAWIILKLLTAFDDMLWNRYGAHFVNFCADENKHPTCQDCQADSLEFPF